MIIAGKPLTKKEYIRMVLSAADEAKRLTSLLKNIKMRVLVLVSVLILASCLGDTNEQNESKVKLINSSKVLLKNLGEETLLYGSNRELFIKPYTSVSYSNDTAYLTTIHEINSCGKTIGEIEYKRDTLFLLTRHLGAHLCNSVEYHKFSYVITIPNKEILNVQF